MLQNSNITAQMQFGNYSNSTNGRYVTINLDPSSSTIYLIGGQGEMTSVQSGANIWNYGSSTFPIFVKVNNIYYISAIAYVAGTDPSYPSSVWYININGKWSVKKGTNVTVQLNYIDLESEDRPIDLNLTMNTPFIDSISVTNGPTQTPVQISQNGLSATATISEGDGLYLVGKEVPPIIVTAPDDLTITSSMKSPTNTGGAT